MAQEEPRIFSDGGEASRESLKKMKPDKLPQRGPGIAVLEKLRRDDPQKSFYAGTELVVHPIRPQSNPPVHSTPQFDPRSSFGHYPENFPISPPQLLDSSPMVSSNGMAPMFWSSVQCDASSCPNSLLSVATPETKEPPRGPQLPMPSLLLRQKNQQKISQGLNYPPLFPVPGGRFQMESEPPSIQSCHDFMHTSSWTDQQRTMHQRVGMKRPWPFQTHAFKNQRSTSSNYDAMMINGPQEKNSDWLTVEGNLNRNHSTVERNCLPRMKKAEESAGSKASDAPWETQSSFNFIGLHPTEYAADPRVIPNQIRRDLERLDDVDVELKL